MTDKPCIYAWSGPGGPYEPYINFTRDNEKTGDLIVTLRGVGRDCARVVLPFEEVRTMVAVLYDYQLLHRLGAMTANAKAYTVYINGTAHLIPDDVLTYDQILGLAQARRGSDVVWMKKERNGTVRKNDSIRLEDGMRFEVAFTGSA